MEVRHVQIAGRVNAAPSNIWRYGNARRAATRNTTKASVAFDAVGPRPLPPYLGGGRQRDPLLPQLSHL